MRPINNIFIVDIKNYLSTNNLAKIKQILSETHPADIAELLKLLSFDNAISVFKLVEKDKISSTLKELENAYSEKILATFPPEAIANELTKLDTDDAVDIIAKLPKDRKESVITLIKDTTHAKRIIELLRYEKDTAGGLMAKELISVNENWNVATTLKQIKLQAEEVSKVHSIYVVNDTFMLKGRLSLKDLLSQKESIKIKDLYISDINVVNVNEKSEDVANIMSKYNLESIPVIDEIGCLVGCITIDDVIDVIKDEADRDYQLAAGITEDIETNDTIWKLSRARLPWLIIGTIGGLTAASIINELESFITLYPVLFIFVPLIQATAGNVGVQSSAIIVQSIANQSLKNTIYKRIFKEIIIGLINGSCLTLLVLLICIFSFKVSYLVSLTVSVSLITIVLKAGLIGTITPYLLNKRKIDPALATGPFITTSADVLGILIYFFIAKLILL